MKGFAWKLRATDQTVTTDCSRTNNVRKHSLIRETPMRIKAVFLAASLALCGATPALAQSGNDLFQQGLVQEQAEGNLLDAIRLYTRVVTEYVLDRPLVARALVQIGRRKEKKHTRPKSPVPDHTSSRNINWESRSCIPRLQAPTGNGAMSTGKK